MPGQDVEQSSEMWKFLYISDTLLHFEIRTNDCGRKLGQISHFLLPPVEIRERIDEMSESVFFKFKLTSDRLLAEGAAARTVRVGLKNLQFGASAKQ